MRQVLILIIMFFSVSTISAQEQVKKWNDLYSRYDYYDSKGNLIGYEKWNSLYNRWEYFSTKKKTTDSYYRDYSHLDKSPYNLELTERLLREKQNLYDKRLAVIFDIAGRINSYLTAIYENGYETPFIKREVETYNEALRAMNNTDLTNIASYRQCVDWLLAFEKRMYKWTFKQEEAPQKEIIKEKANIKAKPKTYPPGTYNVYEHSPILNGTDSMKSKEIAKAGKTIEVLEKVTDRFYKVKASNGRVGYFDLPMWIKE